MDTQFRYSDTEVYLEELILVEPRTNSIKDDVFLGKTSGKIIKQTQIPALIVPEGYVFKPVNKVLMAVK